MQFWIATIISTGLIIVPGIVSFIKEENVRLRWWVLYPTLLGGIFSLCTSYTAHNDSVRYADTAKFKDSLYQDLLRQNLKSAKKIIDSLDIALYNSRNLITGNNKILSGQKNNLEKLDTQLALSAGIQKSVNSSGKRFMTTLNYATRAINDNLTGGDGYCKAIVIPYGSGSGEFNIANLSSLSIPNVGVQFTNYTRSLDCPFRYFNGKLVLDSACASKTSGELTIPKINRRDTVRIYDTDELIGNIGHLTKFVIRFNLPNKLYWQLLILQASGHHITTLSVLLTLDGNKRNIFYYDSPGAKTTNWDKEFNRPLQTYNASDFNQLRYN